jgi:hypothetical protein
VPAIELLRTAERFRRSRSPFQEPFPFSPVGFPPDDEGNILIHLIFAQHFRQVQKKLSTAARKGVALLILPGA